MEAACTVDLNTKGTGWCPPGEPKRRIGPGGNDINLDYAENLTPDVKLVDIQPRKLPQLTPAIGPA
jgi:hypothetical protein